MNSDLQPASFPATRADALRRLAAFVPHAGGTYAKTRNFDLGAEARDNVSLLSPYLRHRLISEDEVVRAVLAQHSLAAAEKFIQEIVWRAYWKGWLEFRPAVWDRYLATLEQSRAGLKGKAVLAKQLADAEAGRTGIACFDAWAKELATTGYLHNHARMWFASIWIFTLKLPWALGADFFLRHLLDGDAASNTLSWRWVAGLHTKGKTYLARPDNIDTFTRGRFGPTPKLAGAAIPLEPDGEVVAGRLGPVDRLGVACPCALLITEDDLTPELWAIPRQNVRCVIVLDTATAYPGVAGRVVNFKRGATADCVRRIGNAFGQEPVVISALMPDAGRQIAARCQAAGRVPLVMHEMPVGPARTEAQPVIAEVKHSGQEVRVIRRAWDDAFWPHATAGFFKVKNEIPGVLRTLKIAGGPS